MPSINEYISTQYRELVYDGGIGGVIYKRYGRAPCYVCRKVGAIKLWVLTLGTFMLPSAWDSKIASVAATS